MDPEQQSVQFESPASQSDILSAPADQDAWPRGPAACAPCEQAQKQEAQCEACGQSMLRIPQMIRQRAQQEVARQRRQMGPQIRLCFVCPEGAQSLDQCEQTEQDLIAPQQPQFQPLLQRSGQPSMPTEFFPPAPRREMLQEVLTRPTMTASLETTEQTASEGVPSIGLPEPTPRMDLPSALPTLPPPLPQSFSPPVVGSVFFPGGSGISGVRFTDVVGGGAGLSGAGGFGGVGGSF